MTSAMVAIASTVILPKIVSTLQPKTIYFVQRILSRQEAEQPGLNLSELNRHCYLTSQILILAFKK